MKKTKQRKHILIVIVFIVVLAIIVTYVLPLTVLAAPETPPPEQPATDWGYDETTLDIPPYDEGDEEEDVPIPVLKITSGPIRLDVGQQAPVSYEMTDFPEGTLLEWSTSDPRIAAIGADGIVVARSPGSTEVIARAGQKRASVLVQVNDLRANNVVISLGEGVNKTGNKSYEVKVGDVIRLTAKIEPEGAKVDKISWLLGNERVASLSQSGKNAEFVANAIGQTQVTVMAGTLTDSITIEIIESGVALSTIWDYIKYVIIIVVAAVAIIVILTVMAQTRKKEKARQRAAAKRRREEVERRAREEEAGRRAREEEAARRVREDAEARRQREMWEIRPGQAEERSTMRVSGAAVGAGIAAPKDGTEEPERPLTLDDLD